MTDVWLTPPHILAAVGGWESFDLDPCGSEAPPWPTARRTYTWRDNGLRAPWSGRVWMNPPYSKPAPWMGRLAAHGRGVALIPANTGTAYFQEAVFDRASAVFWIAGRLRFCRPDGRPAKDTAAFPVVLCAYGRRDAEVLAWLEESHGREFGRFEMLALPRLFALRLLGAGDPVGDPDEMVGVSWREAVTAWLRARPGPVRLAEAYQAFARHPKAQGRAHYQAKIRQTLQRGARPVGPGLWASRESEAA